VTFHETFWVITGTAAPVIALAGVVSLVEVSRQQVDVSDLARGLPYNIRNEKFIIDVVDSLEGKIHRAYRLQLANVVLQSALAVSLLSVNYQSNVVPSIAAVVAEVLARHSHVPRCQCRGCEVKLQGEHLVHALSAGLDHGSQLEPVDSLRHSGRAVADQTRDLLCTDPVIAHERDERSPQLARRPVLSDPGSPADVLEHPLLGSRLL
jgi:hypothetical protein